MWHVKNILNFQKGSLLYSVLGFAIAILATASVFYKDASWTEASVGIVLGLAIAGFKVDGNGSSPSIPIIAIGMLLFFPKCVPQHIASISDSTYVVSKIVHDTVTVPGDSVKLQIPCETLIKDNSPIREILQPSKKGIANLKVYKKDNKVYAECDCLPYTQTIDRLQKEIYHLKSKVILQPCRSTECEPNVYDSICRVAAPIFLILFLLLAYLITR